MTSYLSDRILDRRDRRRLIPYSDVHVFRLERAGKFPKRVQLGANRVGWSERELLDWIEQHKFDRDLKLDTLEVVS